MEDILKLFLTFNLLVTLRSLVQAYPFSETARFSPYRQRTLQESYGGYGGSPRDTVWSANQYYPPALWAETLLKLSETPRAETADYADEYAYDAGEPDEGIVTDVDSSASEESLKDLLLSYLMRQQELLPRVQRRNEKAKDGKSTVAPSTVAAPSSTVATVKFDQGQKEVPILRPPSDSRRQTLSWPKELEETSEEQQHSGKQHLHSHKVSEDKGAFPAGVKGSADLLALQLDNLKPENH